MFIVFMLVYEDSNHWMIRDVTSSREKAEQMCKEKGGTYAEVPLSGVVLETEWGEFTDIGN